MVNTNRCGTLAEVARKRIVRILHGPRIMRRRPPTCGAWEEEVWNIPNRMNSEYTH